MEERLIIAGFGGQGILFCGKVWADIMTQQGHQVTYIPSYGAEVRGGTCNCHVIVSEEEIASPVVEAATSLIIMNQPSLDRFAGKLLPDGLIVANASMADAEPVAGRAKVLAPPATDIANELGNVRVANAVMMGVYNAAKHAADPAELESHFAQALGSRKADLVAVNVEALRRGREWFLARA